MKSAILINVTPAEAGVISPSGSRFRGNDRWIHTTVSRRFLSLFLIGTLLAGCSPEWKQKFMRKKKGVSGPQPVLTLESNVQATHPADVRYREHFAYWKSWNSELLGSYGQMRKRDLRNLSGVISELRSMEDILTGPPADHLRGILQQISAMEEKWRQEPDTWTPPTTFHSRLEQLMREIDKSFYYKKVKAWVPAGKGTEPLPNGKS